MTREETIAKINKLCQATVCYSCNFSNICGNISNLAELPDYILDAMISNGNIPGSGTLHLITQEVPFV